MTTRFFSPWAGALRLTPESPPNLTAPPPPAPPAPSPTPHKSPANTPPPHPAPPRSPPPASPPNPPQTTSPGLFASRCDFSIIPPITSRPSPSFRKTPPEHRQRQLLIIHQHRPLLSRRSQPAFAYLLQSPRAIHLPPLRIPIPPFQQQRQRGSASPAPSTPPVSVHATPSPQPAPDTKTQKEPPETPPAATPPGVHPSNPA